MNLIRLELSRPGSRIKSSRDQAACQDREPRKRPLGITNPTSGVVRKVLVNDCPDGSERSPPWTPIPLWRAASRTARSNGQNPVAGILALTRCLSARRLTALEGMNSYFRRDAERMVG